MTGRVAVTAPDLAIAGGFGHVGTVMKRRWPRQTLALCLAVFLGLGWSLFGLPTAEQAVGMTMAAEHAGAFAEDDCSGCGGGVDGDTSVVTCAPAFTCTGMPALLWVERSFAAPDSAEQFVSAVAVARHLTASPEPYPPRSPDRG